MIVGRDQALLDGLGDELLAIQTAAVVANLDNDAVALVEGVERDLPDLRLARGAALVRRLDAVIDRVADHVHEWIGDLLNDVLVELGLLAADDEFDLLAGLAGHVPDEATHLLEGGADGHHAHRHRGFLDVADDLGDLRDVSGQLLVGADNLAQADHRLGDDEFTDRVHQRVELRRVHADRVIQRCRLAGLRAAHAPRRSLRVIRSRRRDGDGPTRAARRAAGSTRRRRLAAVLPGRGTAQRVHDLADVGLRTGAAARGRQVVPHLGKLELERVDRREDQVHDRGRDLHLAAPAQIENRLDLVRQPVHVAQVEEARDALDRVERSEQLVELIGVAGIRLDCQEPGLDRIHVLGGLVEEALEVFALVEVQLERLADVRLDRRLRRGRRGDGWWRRGGRRRRISNRRRSRHGLRLGRRRRKVGCGEWRAPEKRIDSGAHIGHTRVDTSRGALDHRQQRRQQRHRVVGSVHLIQDDPLDERGRGTAQPRQAGRAAPARRGAEHLHPRVQSSEHAKVVPSRRLLNGALQSRDRVRSAFHVGLAGTCPPARWRGNRPVPGSATATPAREAEGPKCVSSHPQQPLNFETPARSDS